jgi:hypothetical protein
MKNNLTFEDILNPNSFLELQNTFKYSDDRTGKIVDFFGTPQMDDFSIVYGGLNPETGENEIHEEFFYKDYLFPKLGFISESYLSDFIDTYEDLKLHNGNIDYYYRQKKEELIYYYEFLYSSTHLPYASKGSIEYQLYECLESIQEIHSKEKLHLGDKMNFKMIRQDVLVLFYLLREKGLIKYHSNSELKVLLENNFMSYDNKTKEYKNFTVGKNTFSDFKSGNRPINKSIERLKKYFIDEGFFDIT